MLAILRYRRIAYRLLYGGAADTAGLPKPAVDLLPTFYLPGADGELEAVTDSTPLIRRFERDFCGRNVLPPNPVMRFIDAVIEDYADEWLTKAMFHYRWHYAADIEKAGNILPLQFAGICTPEPKLQGAKAHFSQRQIGRLTVVGSNPTTAPLIEAAYARLLDVMDAHLRCHPFLMGARPGASDFAVYGQLTQLALFDPTSMIVTLARSPRVYAWTGLLDDLSGLEPSEQDWTTPDRIPATLAALLSEVGRTYVPLLLANARALLAGDKHIDTVIDGQRCELQTVTYQGKCLRWLREEFASLGSNDQEVATELLQRTGCASLIFEPLAFG